MKLDILSEAIERCLDEMYRYAQPSITFEELKELSKKEFEETGKPQPVHERYYLSPEEYKVIEEKYLDAYNLIDKFKDHCDLIIRDMKEGCSKDKWIEGKDGFPGHRGYKKVPSLDNEIGEENLNKVIDFIEMRKNFYRINKDEQRFRFSVMNYSPYSNKEAVINYWKSKGIDLKIEDRDKDDMWEVHEYGITWEDWNKENEEYNNEKE